MNVVWINNLAMLRWDEMTTADWIAIALTGGATIVVWAALILLRWSRPKTRKWNGKEIV